MSLFASPPIVAHNPAAAVSFFIIIYDDALKKDLHWEKTKVDFPSTPLRKDRLEICYL